MFSPFEGKKVRKAKIRRAEDFDPREEEREKIEKEGEPRWLSVAETVYKEAEKRPTALCIEPGTRDCGVAFLGVLTPNPLGRRH